MLEEVQHGATGVILRGVVRSTATGVRLTGLAHDSAGLVVSTIADNEAAGIGYTQAAGDIETIATIGTYQAPSSGKCRFKAVDAALHPGLYEFHFADARFAVTGAKKLFLAVSGASAELDGIVILNGYDRTAEPADEGDLVAALYAAAAVTPLPVDAVKVNGVALVGDGAGTPVGAA